MIENLLIKGELPPVRIEVEDSQLQKIALYVIGMAIVIFILKSTINNLLN